MSKSGKFVIRQLIIVIAVILLALVAFVLGLMIGYGKIGNGQHMTDILSSSKIHHIIEQFTGK